MNRIIFGNACYLMNGLIRIRKREWNTVLPSGKSWKKPYLAKLSGWNGYQFDRTFIHGMDRTLNGVDAVEWALPTESGSMIEFGWVYDNLKSHDANTHYLINVDGMWIEVSKDRMIKNVSVIK